jgi:hypothetical protein
MNERKEKKGKALDFDFGHVKALHRFPASKGR